MGKRRLAKRVRATMQGRDNAIVQVVVGPGAKPFPLPEKLLGKMREEGGGDPDDMDLAVYYFALGAAWSLSVVDEPLMSIEDRGRVTREAAGLACMDFNSIEPVL
jgi:hypothetical protein